jgi:predicted nucleotidyltransferase
MLSFSTSGGNRRGIWHARRPELLREKYHVSRVVAFGSLVRKDMFTPWSDVDIAAWGIAPDETFRAIADVLFLSSHIEVNLVDVNTSSASLLAAIEREGVDL